MLGDEIAMGPGKAALIEAIAREGSISAAARTLDMSYRRAWLLVDTLNRCFVTPVVETHPGESARVTEQGLAILAAYRRLTDRLAPPPDDPDVATIANALCEAPRPRR